MIKQILYKLFGLEDAPCPMCELLKTQLATSEYERKELLDRLLGGNKKEDVQTDTKTLQPIVPQTIPWSVRKRMLENEDREKARVMRESEKEVIDSKIENLEKELGVEDAK